MNNDSREVQIATSICYAICTFRVSKGNFCGEVLEAQTDNGGKWREVDVSKGPRISWCRKCKVSIFIANHESCVNIQARYLSEMNHDGGGEISEAFKGGDGGGEPKSILKDRRRGSWNAKLSHHLSIYFQKSLPWKESPASVSDSTWGSPVTRSLFNSLFCHFCLSRGAISLLPFCLRALE